MEDITAGIEENILLRRMEPEGDHILDYAIEYKLSVTYPPSLTNDKKRAVRKRAGTLIADNGEIYVERKSERCHFCKGARTHTESLPFRCHVWAFWFNKDMEESCRKILLARNCQSSEGNGNFS